MTQRTQRRAAERKAHKFEEKRQRNLAKAAVANASLHPVLIAAPEPPRSLVTQELKLSTASAPVSSASVSISDAQLTANRANANLSTGPVTDEGKAISARNNFRHGLTGGEGDVVLLGCESAEEYAQSLAAFTAEWQPVTATELDLVERLVSHQWLRRRALNLQKRFLSSEDGLILDEKQFNLYRRYEVQHERAFNKAFSDLMRLRSLHIREQNGFESQRRKNEQHEYHMRRLKHREHRDRLADLTAEARLVLAQNKQTGVVLPDPGAVTQVQVTCDGTA